MLVWSINRTDDGPFNAFKNLGDDLASNDPKTANDNLISMACSIVRSAIANSTIETMLRDRASLRQQVRKEMFEVVKGWGVWLETVEITDVTISSASLFKDLQANFRENMKRTAEMYRMNVESEVKVIQASKQQEINVVLNANEKELNEYKNIIAMELTQINLAQT